MYKVKLGSLIVFVGAVFGVLTGKGQSLQLRSARLIDDKFVVNYDLVDTVPGRLFIVRLYSSKDNFLNPLKESTGDCGMEVPPGLGKKIVWDVRKEFGPDFSESISFEIRAKTFVPFINLSQINQFRVFKRRTKYNLTWSGGSTQSVLNFDLMNRDRKVMTFPNIANVGYHSFEFPSGVRVGRRYHFRVSDTKNKDDVVNSRSFRIKRKIPLALKAALAIGVGATVYMLMPAEDDFRISDPPTPQ